MCARANVHGGAKRRYGVRDGRTRVCIMSEPASRWGLIGLHGRRRYLVGDDGSALAALAPAPPSGRSSSPIWLGVWTWLAFAYVFCTSALAIGIFYVVNCFPFPQANAQDVVLPPRIGYLQLRPQPRGGVLRGRAPHAPPGQVHASHAPGQAGRATVPRC